MPTISASNYGGTQSYYTLGNPQTFTDSMVISTGNPVLGQAWGGGVPDNSDTDSFTRAVGRIAQKLSAPAQPIQSMSKRIVRVYLADADDALPLDKSLLYTGAEKLTDATDQELYFEIPIMEILKQHNAYRATVVDKKLTQKIGKEAFLEPVKIRDLKMTVVSIATF